MDEKIEKVDLLLHLKDFEDHCILHDNLQGAEIINNAQKRIKELEAENRRFKRVFKLVMPKLRTLETCTGFNNHNMVVYILKKLKALKGK